MQTESAIQPPGSLVAGVIPDRVSVDDERAADPPKVSRRAVSASSPRRRGRVRVVLAELLSVVRGDRYMVNAYPPAWRDAEAARNSDHDQVDGHGFGCHRDTEIGDSEVAAAEHTKDR